MSPALSNGRLAHLAFCSAGELRGGDIIIFKNREGFIAHRLINKIMKNGRWLLRTKGDISFHADNAVGVEALVGKVIGVKRCGLYLPINNPLGRMIGLLFAYLAPLVYYVKQQFNNLYCGNKVTH
ncbi:MAG: hypothetical protein AAB019_03840 [Planctomycetota bacterium]